MALREMIRTCQILRFVTCHCYEVWRWDCGSVSWDEQGRSDRMRCVVADFVREGVNWGGASYTSAIAFRKFLLL